MVELPDSFDVRKILQNSILGDDRQVEVFRGGNNDFVVEFGNILEINHLPQDVVIEWNEHEVVAVIYHCEQLLEVEGYPLLVKDAERFSDDNRRDKDDRPALFAPLKNTGGGLTNPGAVGEPPKKCVGIRYVVHGSQTSIRP